MTYETRWTQYWGDVKTHKPGGEVIMQPTIRQQGGLYQSSFQYMYFLKLAIVITLLVSCPSSLLNADPSRSTSFIPESIDSAVRANSPLFAVDLNGDNLRDIMTAYKGQFRHGVWYENTGLDETPYIIHEMSFNDRYLLLPANIDQDKRPDIVTGFECYSLQWRRNDGSSAPDFTEAHLVDDREVCFQPIVTADLDGDTDIDVLTPYSWYENSGGSSTSFTKRQLDPRSLSLRKFFAAADLDADGDMDIVVDDFQLKWLENQNNGNGDSLALVFHLFPTGIDDGYIVDDAVTQDVEGDGDIDVVTARIDTNYPHIDWFENDGHGQFTYHNIAQRGANALATADVDGDLDIDLIYADENDLGWYEASATPHDASNPMSFTHHPIDTSTFKSLCAADMDNDGDTDFLAGSGTALYLYENLTIQATPTPSPTATISPTPQPTINPAQLDLNHDGLIDALDLLLFQSHWHETSYE